MPLSFSALLSNSPAPPFFFPAYTAKPGLHAGCTSLIPVIDGATERGTAETAYDTPSSEMYDGGLGSWLADSSSTCGCCGEEMEPERELGWAIGKAEGGRVPPIPVA